MDDSQRGKIRNKVYALQVNDFSGLKFEGGITPTDIDGLIEYHNQGYIFIETKYKDAEILHGQKLAFQRLCDNLNRTKPTIFLIASHETKTEDDIDVAGAIVTELRWMERWVVYKVKKTTVREFIERFMRYVDTHYKNMVCPKCNKPITDRIHKIPGTWQDVCGACCPVCNLTQEYIDETCEKCGRDFSKLVCDTSLVCPECL